MSLITRCPACSTLFKVVPDQLRISSGWVRCGRCDEVFDATAHMLATDAVAAFTALAAQPLSELPRPGVPESPHQAASVAAAPTAAAMPVPLAERGGADAAQSARAREPLAPAVAAAATARPDAPPVAWQTLASSPSPEWAEPAPSAAAPTQRLPPTPTSAPVSTPEAADQHAAPSLPWATAESQVWRNLSASRTVAALQARGGADEPPPVIPPAAPAPQAPVLKNRRAMGIGLPPPSGAEPDDASSSAVAGELADMPVAAPAADVPPAPPAAAVDFMLSGVGGVAARDDASVPALRPPAGQTGGIADGADGTAPSFVAQARRRAFWSARPLRLAAWLLLGLLLAGLALQVALGQRDWLAAREPRLAPVLRALCQPLGCVVAPYRLLDAIVIDSSAFHRVSAGQFRFSVTLRNMADMPVAMPALELTLTDAQEQPLVRRVLSAAELDAPEALAARAEFSGARALTVAEAATSSAIVSYRLMAFYP